MRSLYFLLALSLFFVPSATAACWKKKDNTYVESAKSPSSGARRTSSRNCAGVSKSASPASSSKIKRVVVPIENLKGFSVRPDTRQCTKYVQDRTGIKPSGIAYERPDSEHKAWKQALIDKKLKDPRKGDVAIIAASAAWHVAYVEEVGASYPVSYQNALGRPDKCWITISETNYKDRYYQKRTAVSSSCSGAWAKLKIKGFYRP